MCKESKVVNTHDFKSDSSGIAIPYGVYDIVKKKGFVCIGTSNDTSEYSVSVIKEWWETEGRFNYSKKELQILADGGGSNSYRSRLFKKELQEKLCDELGLKVYVSHYPRGCSKWNPIEHRLFGPISINWSGEPLKTYSHVLNYIRGTSTAGGLNVTAIIDYNYYPKGKKVSNKDFSELNLTRHSVCPQWNYTLKPRSLQHMFDFMSEENYKDRKG